MDFDQLATTVELHQLTVTPYFQLCPRRTGAIGSRVDGIAVVDVMVLMHGSGMPVRDIIGITIIGQEFGFFLFLEDHQRQTPGGAMDPLPGYLQAPAPRLLAQVLKVVELPALEEAFSGIRHLAFDFWLIFWMTWSRRVGDKAAVLGVLQKAASQPWIERVRTDHRSREVIQDQIPGYAAKESPGRLQSLNDVSKLLAKQRP
ncbi:hypothetical protein ES708_13817 [subsurface metagenome]